MSTAPYAVRSQYSHLYGSSMLPVLEEIIDYELSQHPSRRDMLFKKVSTDRDIWQSTEMHDLPLFENVTEGSDISVSRPSQGASKTLSVKKMARGFSISREAVEDGKFDLISDMVRKLAKSAKESQEVDAMNIINNGLAGTELTADGVAVFSTSHTLPSGGTFRNRLSSDADLSTTSLATMLTDFETQFVGDSGIIYAPKPKYLWCHSSNKRYAMEILESQLKADTPNNNMNPFVADGLIVVSSPHLSDTDAWGLAADASETGLRIVEREALRFSYSNPDEGAGFLSEAMICKATYREQVGCVHPIGLFGTVGA